ncbi:acyltransferase family protein [Xanthocytophaga flava]|uniref:acyltransferase family protein n=1 Tax=Xanthocytophaga flava TaxID=3048013 RepID=UPI0028D238E3|nr:acyltransferase [Xanthocytophaga flavus]MDJ1472154.1 acyltransferase [Xanthocytophaga flavus]
MGRIYSLDYLRGLAACTVMFGHYYAWYYHEMDSENFLQRLVTYSVCIFYILSGLTLYLVNARTFKLDLESFTAFAIKRVVRIFPLLWLCIALTILYSGWPHWKIILLNLTGLFGFTQYSGGIAIASWSIGMEMVFYFTFPVFFLLLYYKQYLLFTLLTALTFAVGYYYAFVLISPDADIHVQWNKFYIKPLNHLYLFAGGIALGYFKKYFFYPKQTLLNISIALCLVAFAIYPTEPNQSEQIWGYNRLFFVVLSFALCWCFAVSHWELPNPIHKTLHFLGEKSYSIYLLHPIVFHFFKISYLATSLKYGLSIGCTLLLSYLVYNMIEKPAMNWGKEVCRKLTTPLPA